MSSLSMKTKLILLGLLPGIVILIILLTLVSSHMHSIVNRNMDILRDTLLTAHKSELRHSLEIADSLIQPLYDAAPTGDSVQRAEAINLLKRLNYGNDGYYFGYDGASARVFSGTDTAKMGESFRDYQDVNGVYLINELVKQAQSGDGFVTYHFPRLGQGDTAYPKLSYAIWLEKWNLMIGTGFYIDGIDDAVAAARNAADQHIRSTLISVFSAALLLLAVMALLTLYFAKKTLAPLNGLVYSLEQIARGGGDLTQRLQRTSNDEIGAVITAFNTFVDSVHAMIQRIQQLTQEVVNIGQQVSHDTNATHKTLDEQRDQTLQVASAVNEMAASAVEVARSTQDAAAAANIAETSTKNAQATATKSIENIQALSSEVKLNTEGLQQLQKDVNEIGAVSDVIRSIAEQTNLLALNASIEAARAGEQGRGFAVVADEVRALAGRTQASTQEIQDMIQRLQTSTTAASDSIKRSLIKGDTSVELVCTTSTALREIDQQVSTISQRGLQIAAAAEEQTQVIESVNRSMHLIADATESANDYAARSYKSGTELVSVGAELQQLVGQFKT